LYKRSPKVGGWSEDEEKDLLRADVQRTVKQSKLFGEYEDPQKEDNVGTRKRIENHHFFNLLKGHP